MNIHRIFRKIGLALLLIPVGFFLFFGIGEMLSSTPGSFIHFIQIMPIIALLFFAFYNAEWAGYLLVIEGVLFGIAFAPVIGGGFMNTLIIELMICVMPIISGILLLESKPLMHK